MGGKVHCFESDGVIFAFTEVLVGLLVVVVVLLLVLVLHETDRKNTNFTCISRNLQLINENLILRMSRLVTYKANVSTPSDIELADAAYTSTYLPKASIKINSIANF